MGTCKSYSDAEKFVEQLRKVIYDFADTAASAVAIDVKTKAKLLYRTREEEKRLMTKYIPHIGWFEKADNEDKNTWMKHITNGWDFETELDILKKFRIGDVNKPLATNDAISLGSAAEKKFVVQMMSTTNGEKEVVTFPALIPITEEWKEYRKKNELWEYEPGDTVKENNP